MAIVIDPACGMEVDRSRSMLTRARRHDILLLRQGLLLEFTDGPGKCLAADYQPSM